MATDTITRTKYPFHNDCSAHLEPTSSSKSSDRRRFAAISSDNTNSSPDPSSHRLESCTGIKGLNLSRPLLNVLDEELSVEVQGPARYVTFSEIGLGSLMSLSVIGRLREAFCLGPSFDIIPEFFNDRWSSEEFGGRM